MTSLPASRTPRPRRTGRARAVRPVPAVDHRRFDIEWMVALPCAHRGLHSAAVPENSLAAFEAAATAGYGIELDVQLSRDGQVMVFHDLTLERMTGDVRRIDQVDAGELMTLTLTVPPPRTGASRREGQPAQPGAEPAGVGVPQQIPTLEQVFAVVAGRVPVFVEVKNIGRPGLLEQQVAHLLADYDGPVATMSFNPATTLRLRRELRALRAAVPVGQSVAEYNSKGTGRLLSLLLRAMPTNLRLRPQFLCVPFGMRTDRFVRGWAQRLHCPVTLWTVIDGQLGRELTEQGYGVIFEGYVPQPAS